MDTNQELGEFLQIFNKESERGITLLAASILDDWLKNMLDSFFAEVGARNELLEGFNAPLGTFYCLNPL